MRGLCLCSMIRTFEIDEFSQEYLALHPMAATTNKPSLLEEHFAALSDDDDEQSISGSDVSEDEHDDINDKSTRKSHVPKFYEVKDNRHAEAFWNHESLADEESLPLGERVAQRQPQGQSKDVIKHGQGGSREISFKPRSSTKYKEYDNDDLPPRFDKRKVSRP